jgi:hypothetical protein
MASIENRSRFIVTVQNREDLTETFAYNRDKQLKLYIAKLCTAQHARPGPGTRRLGIGARDH